MHLKMYKKISIFLQFLVYQTSIGDNPGISYWISAIDRQVLSPLLDPRSPQSDQCYYWHMAVYLNVTMTADTR